MNVPPSGEDLIQNSDGLQALADVCLASECVGLDTEFVWERTYYPRLGIVQVSVDDGRCFLVDVPAVGSLEALGPVLEDRDTVKILHDAPQDLTILRRESGAFPKNVFDTRVAAGFCGYRASLSLQDLLRSALDVSLPKSETRTDWLRRPLSERQLQYAIDDVKHLIPLRAVLLEKAGKLDRDGWMQEELDELDAPEQYRERDPDEQDSRVRGAGRLNPAETAILQSLARWREHTARDVDLPRGHVVTDETLVQIARRKPRKESDLKGIRSMPPQVRERFGEGVLEAVREGLATAPVNTKGGKRQPTPRDDVRSDFALAYVRGKALDAGIDPTLVGTKQEVRSLVEQRNGSDEESKLLVGWRRTFVGEELMEILAGERAVRLGGRAKLPRIE